MQQEKDYTKLGGYLKVYVVLGFFALLSIAFLLVTIVQSAVAWAKTGAPPNGMLQFTLGVLALVVGSLNIMHLVQIVKRDHDFLRTFQICFAVGIPISLANIFVFVSTFKAALETEPDEGMLGAFLLVMVIVFSIALAIGIASSLLHVVYFCRSVRVATYMGGTEFRQRALFRLGELAQVESSEPPESSTD